MNATVKDSPARQRVDCACFIWIIEAIHEFVPALQSIAFRAASGENLDIATVFVVVVYTDTFAARRSIMVFRKELAERIEFPMATVFVRHIAFEVLVRLS